MINRIKTWRLGTVSPVGRVTLVSRVTDDEVGHSVASLKGIKKQKNKKNAADVESIKDHPF